jgi:hypothetical protein
MGTSRSTYENAGNRRLVGELHAAALNGRLSRREVARRAVALGLAGPAVGVLLAATGRSAAAMARQEATPAADFVPIGEQLDLANLSPGIPEPAEPVTVTFASWVNESR